MSAEEQLQKYSSRITRMSTVLLMIAVVAYFLTLLFGVEPVYELGVLTGADAYILGMGNIGAENLIYLKDMGPVFAVFNAVLWAIVRLCAGLSFAAVCFDESKNIWFRVISVAALMLIIFGGLRLM